MARLSLIICTRNRAEQLHRCLNAIQRSDVSSHDAEVIVVDNGSTDATEKVFTISHKIQDLHPALF